MSECYQKFIDEAFIEPIRSVLIVDDDYPTYHDILISGMESPKGDGKGKSWRHNPEHIRKVIETFRNRNPPLLVDIHDGSNVSQSNETKVAQHLHQSDLLVLDFELDKLNSEDGTRAIEILQNLTTSSHFNLVVVYTIFELDAAFYEVLKALIAPSQNHLSDKENQLAEELIEKCEDNHEGFRNKLFVSISNEQYFDSRANSNYLRKMGLGEQPYSLFSMHCKTANWDSDQKKLVLRYVLAKFEKCQLDSSNSEFYANVRWSFDAKWIKSDSVFVTFCSKSVSEEKVDDLLATLRLALYNWNPAPSRLFLTKIRAEMDDYGVAAQSSVLTNKFALAYWYHRLLTSGKFERRTLIAESLYRHSDQLMREILSRVEDYVESLLNSQISEDDANELCKHHFDVNLVDNNDNTKALREHNSFVCSKPPEGWHLTTGHVFRIGDEYWICLSPSCDMVPSQISQKHDTTFGKKLPFTAVRLLPDAREKPLHDAVSTRYIFLNLNDNDEVKIFRFNNSENSAPDWYTFYAKNRGQFNSENRDFIVYRVEIGSRKLIVNPYDAVVVGQLRYAYALNLVQKLGTHFTRVGLDFASKEQ